MSISSIDLYKLAITKLDNSNYKVSLDAENRVVIQDTTSDFSLTLPREYNGNLFEYEILVHMFLE